MSSSHGSCKSFTSLLSIDSKISNQRWGKNPFQGLLQLWERKWGMAVNAEAEVKGTKAAWPVSQNTLLLPPPYYFFLQEKYFSFHSPFLGLIFLVELRKSTKQVLFIGGVKTSSLFNKEVLCVFLTCCTMGRKTNFHSLCVNCNHLYSCFTVSIAAIIEFSHSLKKYFVIKKGTYIHIYFWLFCRLREGKITHWLVSVRADAFTCCCTAQNKTDLFQNL